MANAFQLPLMHKFTLWFVGYKSYSQKIRSRFERCGAFVSFSARVAIEFMSIITSQHCHGTHTAGQTLGCRSWLAFDHADNKALPWCHRLWKRFILELTLRRPPLYFPIRPYGTHIAATKTLELHKPCQTYILFRPTCCKLHTDEYCAQNWGLGPKARTRSHEIQFAIAFQTCLGL